MTNLKHDQRFTIRALQYSVGYGMNYYIRGKDNDVQLDINLDAQVNIQWTNKPGDTTDTTIEVSQANNNTGMHMG